MNDTINKSTNNINEGGIKPDISFLVSDAENNKAYFGGNQSWFKRNTQARSGCSSIAALNTFLRLTDGFPIEKSAYIKRMNDMYKSMGAIEVPILRKLYDKKTTLKIFNIIPPSFGQSTIGYIKGMLKYASRNGLKLRFHLFPSFLHSYSRGLRFIKKGLEKAGAVTLLTARNRHPLTLYSALRSIASKPENLKGGMRNHFVVITGIDDSSDKLKLIISTWGRIATIDYDDLVRSWHRPGALLSSMVYFTKK